MIKYKNYFLIADFPLNDFYQLMNYFCNVIDNNTVLRLIFGFKLRYLRLEHKKSYAELSQETGLSTSYLNDIEKGKKYPKPDKAELLAKSFGISYDEMVSTKSDKKIQPIIDLITSNFFKLFPAEEFGISVDKALDVFTNAPDKTNAFISTILKMVRSYQIGQEDFYRVALRSYQDIHNNYFHNVEQAAKDFISEYSTDRRFLETYLASLNIKVDNSGLASDPLLSNIRSYFDQENQTLYINNRLSESQLQFQLLKEVGFHLLSLADRPYETILNREVSFEKLLSNFKASYFAVACLIPEDQLIGEIKQLALTTKWDPSQIEKLLHTFSVTPEMLLQRLTNILPQAFGANDLFFIKLKQSTSGRFRMTKELHLSRIHNPYNNRLDEHLCQRWVSLTAINELKEGFLVDGQISSYLDHENSYFCITIAQPGNFSETTPSSVTIGMLITPELRATFNFLKDESLRKKTVHTTCERCPLEDCTDRAARPIVIEKLEREVKISQSLERLSHIHQVANEKS